MFNWHLNDAYQKALDIILLFFKEFPIFLLRFYYKNIYIVSLAHIYEHLKAR